MSSKKEKQRVALANFKKAWAIFGVYDNEYIPGKDSKYAVFEKEEGIVPFGGRDPRKGWGLLSQGE